MAVAFECLMEVLGQDDAAAHRLDPAGAQALGLAKRLRREAIAAGAGKDPRRLQDTAEGQFGLPQPALAYWGESRALRPWRAPGN